MHPQPACFAWQTAVTDDCWHAEKDFVSSYVVPRSPTLRLQAGVLIQINGKGITAANAQQSGLGRGSRNLWRTFTHCKKKKKKMTGNVAHRNSKGQKL